MGSSVNMLPARLAEKTEPTDKVLKMWKHTHLSPFRKSRQSVLKSNNGKVYIFTSPPSKRTLYLGFEDIGTNESDQRVHSDL